MRETAVQPSKRRGEWEEKAGIWKWSWKNCPKKIIKKLYKCGKIVYYVSIKINSNAEAGKGADKRCIVCFFCCWSIRRELSAAGIRFRERHRWRLCPEETDRKMRSPAESRVRQAQDNREHSGAGRLNRPVFRTALRRTQVCGPSKRVCR